MEFAYISSQRLPTNWPGRVAWRGLAAITAIVVASSASADSRTRFYDFEEGLVGSESLFAEDKIDILVLEDTFDCCFQLDWLVPDTNRGVPDGEPIQTWINANVDPTPRLHAVFGTGTGPTFVDVSDQSAIDSPASDSRVAVDFDGTNHALQGLGFRDSYPLRDAFDADASATADNVLGTFFALSQAWVYPDTASRGFSQVVWNVGQQNGGVRITPDGFWEMTAVGGSGDARSAHGVAFDQWTHVAVARGPDSATLFINGTVAAIATGPAEKFGDFVTLGTDEELLELFDGKIDEFSVGGNSDGAFVPLDDLSFFTDLGLAAPTGVPGDVDQDGDADREDYDIWSANVGFSNMFGTGDVTTLVRGDVDHNGRVDFFDFTEIASAAAAAGAPLELDATNVPEPTSTGLPTIAALIWLLNRHKRQSCATMDFAFKSIARAPSGTESVPYRVWYPRCRARPPWRS